MNTETAISEENPNPRERSNAVDRSEAAETISLRGVGKVFGAGADRLKALDDVSMDVHDGEFFTLLGPSGCGKTTLLRMIAGFEHPTSGNILLRGREIAHLPPYRREVNTVFQSYALFPHMTVEENIAFGLQMHHVPRAQVRTRVAEMLALVQLNEYARRKPAQLSGGQQQRVALARALANRPKVLLLDEPLSALDLKLRKEMQIELKRLQTETGITFVFVTHDQEEALTMSDRIAVMNEGRALQIGSPRDIYEHPDNRFVADFIGETNLMLADVVSINGERAAFRLDSGSTIEGLAREELHEGQRVTLAIRPERLTLVESGDGYLQGRVVNVVYFGTDTLFQVEVDEIGLMRVRFQNVEGGGGTIAAGSDVGIRFASEAVQALRD